MRRRAVVMGVVLVLIPALWVLGLFWGLRQTYGSGCCSPYFGWSLVALVLFYGCILAGIAFQRRCGRMGGYSAFRGALQSVTIVAAIVLFGPFVYAALTHTEVRNWVPMGAWIIVIFGTIAAVGTGLIVYGTQASDNRALASGPTRAEELHG